MQIIWEGNWIAPNGHATVTRNMTRALQRQGMQVKLRATEMPPPELYSQFVQRDFLHMLEQPYRPRWERIRILHRTPPDFIQTLDKLTVGMTYVESTAVPEAWAENVNTTVDALVVANQQAAAAFRTSGVTKPIWIVPHGVNVAVFHPLRPRHPDPLRLPPFRFLSVFEWVPRKGYEVLVRAFWSEFSADEDVCLIIKTRSFSAEPGGPAMELRRLKEKWAPPNAAPVFLFDGDLSQSELAQLYRAGSAFVLPTRGESVGLPLLEAAASGLPIITTAFGGPLEFLPPEDAYLVNYALTPVPKPWPVATTGVSLEGAWAEPDSSSLRHQMREVYQNYTTAQTKAARLRQYIVSTRSWNACATTLMTCLKQAVGRPLR